MTWMVVQRCDVVAELGYECTPVAKNIVRGKHKDHL